MCVCVYVRIHIEVCNRRCSRTVQKRDTCGMLALWQRRQEYICQLIFPLNHSPSGVTFIRVRTMAWSGLLTDLLFPHITRRGMPLARVITEGRKRETSLRRRMYGRKQIPPQDPSSSQGQSVP